MSEAVEIIKFSNRTSISNWKEVRMFFLRRRRVFIGECDGQAVRRSIMTSRLERL